MFGSRILLIAAHPDDEVVGCCAAIGRARVRATSVSVLFLTTGIPARERLWPWERSRYAAYVERRRQEAQLVCGKLGLDILGFLDVPSRELHKNLPLARKTILEHAGALQMDILWVPAYEGGHPDHDIANFIAATSRSEAAIWEYSEYNFYGGKTRLNEFVAPRGNETELKLSDEERHAKQRTLAMYVSERQNLNYLRTDRETFRPLADYDYSRPPHPGTLFYRRYSWASFHPRVNHVTPEEVGRAIAEFRL